ncbi:transferase family-domain-containing protein [Hysterangium stoloniferum]|nr:transferase family-domain-containing protein [Hysterangium stoloniferum]
MSLDSLELRINSCTRTYPESADFRTAGPIHAPLSIVDASVARFAPTNAVWVYEKAPPTEILISSLRKTLDAYPQWCGQLHSAKYNPEGNHTERYGRLMLSYGTDSDPGVELIRAEASDHVSTIIPPPIDDHYDMRRIPVRELTGGSTQLALPNMVDVPGLPGIIVQLTRFKCEGMSIAIKMAHPLADAQTLLRFATDWAAICSSMVAGTLVPVISPMFNPQLLDCAAAGDINSQNADKNILRQSCPLPLHRYDWWASEKSSVAAKVASSQIPTEITPPSLEDLGKPLPWSNWDPDAPVSHFILYFSRIELQNMWMEASSQAGRVSHLDVLLAHLWAIIIRARGIELNEESYLDVTFGIRKRLEPPLPPSFLGSPLTLAAVTSTGQEGHAHDISQMARSIRSTLSRFNPKSIPVILHEMMFEITPQRRWNAFLGRQNTIVTSWLDLGVYDVDFGSGRPKYVHAVMPHVDGCIQIIEAGGDRERSPWYEKGAHVSLYLRDDVMSEVLKDVRLRQYR